MKKILAVLMMLTLVLGFLPAGVAAQESVPFKVELMAGQNIDVGEVQVWNDANTLFVKYVVDAGGWCMTETHLAVADDVDDIPQTKKNNPIPGQFTYADSYGIEPCVTEDTYEIPLGDVAVGYEFVIAAHAVVVDTGSEMTEELVSRAGVDVYGPMGAYYEPEDSAWVGPIAAVDTWVHRNWPSVSGATWISTAEYVEDPVNDSWRWFRDELELPEKGYYLDGSVVMATSDNAEEAYHNGVVIGSVGEIEGTSTDDHEWETIAQYPFNPAKGLNTFDFIVRNYGLSGGTQTSNPTGLLYKIKASYYPEESAWGEGTRFTERGNWGMYFTYTVCPAQYVLDITSLNNSTGFTHEFTIVYDPITGDISGTGDSDHAGTQTLSNFYYERDDDGVLTYIAFQSDYDARSYTWYPAFYLEEDGSLTFDDGYGSDNVTSATGTWSLSYVCNGG